MNCVRVIRYQTSHQPEQLVTNQLPKLFTTCFPSALISKKEMVMCQKIQLRNIKYFFSHLSANLVNLPFPEQ